MAKQWYVVTTSAGTRKTYAISRARACRNVQYRLVMDQRIYSQPSPRDLAEMREIEIHKVQEVGSDS